MGIHRIGLVVPSSNVTVETEMPALLGQHADAQFSFHSSRMRMQAVSPEQLRAMNAQRERCILELGDAGVDAILYACLVALMSVGPGEHQRVEGLVAEQLATGGSEAAVRSSAGALIEALRAIGPGASPSSPRTCVPSPSRSSRTSRPRASRSTTGARSRSPTTPRSDASPATG